MRKTIFRRSKNKWNLGIAGFLGIVGGACLLGFGPEKNTCDRLDNTQVNCQIHKYLLFGLQQVESKDLPNLRLVKLDPRTKTTTVHNSDGNSLSEQFEAYVYGVILVNDREHLFNGYSSDVSRQKKIVEDLTTFLNSPTAKHVTTENQNILPGIMGLIFLMMSAVVLVRPLIE